MYTFYIFILSFSVLSNWSITENPYIMSRREKDLRGVNVLRGTVDSVNPLQGICTPGSALDCKDVHWHFFFLFHHSRPTSSQMFHPTQLKQKVALLYSQTPLKTYERTHKGEQSIVFGEGDNHTLFLKETMERNLSLQGSFFFSYLVSILFLH